MYKLNVNQAWKWLLSHMIIATSISYLTTLLLVEFRVTAPTHVMNTATAGIRNISIPIMDLGIEVGIDEGVMIFLVNITVAMLIVAIIHLVRLLNPQPTTRPLLWLRQCLQRDKTPLLLKWLPPFSRIRSRQLRLASLLLLGAPYLATVSFGLMAGALLGSVTTLTSSPLLALAYIIPHGIPEITGILLACSIPVATWKTILPFVLRENTQGAFQQIERVVASPQFQQDLKMIINLLIIAGLIEAHFTLEIVSLVANS